MLPAISSTANAEVKRLAKLARSSGRRESNSFLVEGLRAISGFIEQGWQPLQVVVGDGEELPAAWPQERIRRVARVVIERISPVRSPSGYVAEFPLPEPPPLRAEAGGLVLWELADPGNLGTLLRSAAAFGIEQVVQVGGADPYAPKVVQASAGALAAVAVHRLEADVALSQLGAPTIALVVQDAAGIGELCWPAWLVLGSEARGLPEQVAASCDRWVRLPMATGSESLNAGVAGSLACFLARGLHQA